MGAKMRGKRLPKIHVCKAAARCTYKGWTGKPSTVLSSKPSASKEKYKRSQLMPYCKHCSSIHILKTPHRETSSIYDSRFKDTMLFHRNSDKLSGPWKRIPETSNPRF